MAKSDKSSVVNVGAVAVVLLFFSEIICGNAQTSSTLVPGVITFGDSTVDVGNNDYLYKTSFKANYPPYGRDFKNHEATGRFCNGKLVTDITADTLGFTTYPPAYLSPQASGKNLLLGANFASAGAGYFDETSNLYHALTLSQQLEYFREYQSKLAQIAGSNIASSIVSGSLYIIGIGTGDFVQNYYRNPQLNKAQSPGQYSSFLVGVFTTFIQKLYGLGARRIGVTSLPPLGCLPITIALYGHGNNQCVTRLNIDAQNFNKKLNDSANLLALHHPDLKIAIFDIYTPLYELATTPSKYGFVEGRRTCCGTGTLEPTSVLCNPKSVRTCSNATGYVFWDAVHPSESANQVIADSLVLQGISLIF